MEPPNRPWPYNLLHTYSLLHTFVGAWRIPRTPPQSRAAFAWWRCWSEKHSAQRLPKGAPEFAQPHKFLKNELRHLQRLRSLSNAIYPTSLRRPIGKNFNYTPVVQCGWPGSFLRYHSLRSQPVTSMLELFAHACDVILQTRSMMKLIPTVELVVCFLRMFGVCICRYAL